ncbi:tubulin polyglutamylase, putative (macronuclear) [Tetrahymena thermophila SB210]|uniref:Probable alpha-tubulin polyglutamylase Ttll1 n=1 Tax=Tetrahymena thermophila (strain SB210) TaxID=312017 RepID=TTLL1_TETTS|nr:tubulin polyglutamylase, putative [Tetrahymena thermophila SB210]Q23SI8.2 RecName: Full=Probable alpha-tubulin polyglutamylase Ttll1; AltName: Full=Tubulin-tyrosine ligase family protein 1 [Tetrahymena thermophila SB210]EAR99457.2 tubulin polyglutamylase, putative [Tetrahymena thermophila SB210]|eukprot:XP_001019702.2 tubulin polyglutamylase, putative [Tetrahymena thermophila SB210]
MASKKLKYKTDFDKCVLTDNFAARGWTRCGDKDDDDWNIYWATVWNVRNIFNPKSGIRLNDMQIINHFPNHYELTRKDLMVKNFKRYKKELEKENSPYCQKDENGNYLYLDFIPQTFTLPGEYSLFVEEFHRNPNATWIVKPASRSQGKGIFLLRKIQQLKKIGGGTNSNPLQAFSLKEAYVVSRYIDNPLLVGGRKFDLRIYALVTSYRPLKVYLYAMGFGRFCNEQYTQDIAEMDNMFIHLTNVAIQKFSDKYSEKHGGKWSLQSLRYYLEMVYGTDMANKCFDDINNIIIMSLKSVQSIIINDKHCFEMYGYDILIDENCKPWLIEINASPSLTVTGKIDKELKTELIKNVYQIVIPDDWNDDSSKTGANTSTQTKVGDFNILYDEAQEKKISQQQQQQKKNINSKTIWK